MNRRTYFGAVLGVATTTAVAGCLQGEAMLHETKISATSPTKEWNVELNESDQLRLEVSKTEDSADTVTAYVHHAETGDKITATSATSGHDTFDVPSTGTYTVSIEVSGSTAELILRKMN
ncbi:hypothetical protein ACKVMT_01350 [Halobacteriales archaeon Cl-PHB]